jgi:hypothetical protein
MVSFPVTAKDWAPDLVIFEPFAEINPVFPPTTRPLYSPSRRTVTCFAGYRLLEMPIPQRQPGRCDCHMGAVVRSHGLELVGTTSVLDALHLIVLKKRRLARDLLGLHRA